MLPFSVRPPRYLSAASGDEYLSAPAASPKATRQPAGEKSSRKPPTRTAATYEQIRKHLQNPDGSWRSIQATGKLLRNAGLSASNGRIHAVLQQESDKLPRRPSKSLVSDQQIEAHLRDTDGNLHSSRNLVKTLREQGLNVGRDRALTQLAKAGAQRAGTAATDAEIQALLRHPTGWWRTQREIQLALKEKGLGAGSRRITELMRAAQAKT